MRNAVRLRYVRFRNRQNLLHLAVKQYIFNIHVCPEKNDLFHKKVKFSRYRLGVAQRVGKGIALLFHDRDTRRGERSAARPGRTLTPGKTRYLLYRRLGGPQGQFGRAENLVPTGIRSWTVQPVVSRYTD